MHLLRLPSPSVLLLCLTVLSAAGPARADEVDEVAKLFAEGQTVQALARADRFLAGRPNDAAMRFQKGVVLADLGRADEAIDVYTRLTQDYPALAEPYNNLAVLLTARGEYGQARAALESAIRDNPGYAVAHENLGDVNAALAAQSYARALQLDPSHGTAAPKLALIRELLARTQGRTAAAPRPPS